MLRFAGKNLKTPGIKYFFWPIHNLVKVYIALQLGGSWKCCQYFSE